MHPSGTQQARADIAAELRDTLASDGRERAAERFMRLLMLLPILDGIEEDKQ